MNFRKSPFFTAIILALLVITGITSVFAQTDSDSQVALLTGRHEAGTLGEFYLLSGLKQGQQLFVRVDRISGNLDPFGGLADTELDQSAPNQRFVVEEEQAIAAGRDPLQVLSTLANEFFLVWDDDSGTGYAAVFEWTIPADGDYQLFVTSTPVQDTFGEYRLLVGLNAPRVLSGEAEPAGRLDISRNAMATSSRQAIEKLTGRLTVKRSSTFVELPGMRAKDTFMRLLKRLRATLHRFSCWKTLAANPCAVPIFPASRPVSPLPIL